MDGIIKIMRPITIYQQQKEFFNLNGINDNQYKIYDFDKKTFH